MIVRSSNVQGEQELVLRKRGGKRRQLSDHKNDGDGERVTAEKAYRRRERERKRSKGKEERLSVQINVTATITVPHERKSMR